LLTDARPRPRRRYLLRIAVVLSATVVALFLAELALRLVPSPMSPVRKIFSFVDDERVYVLKPDTEMTFHGTIDELTPPVQWKINEQGMRRESLVNPDETGPRERIALYGDSEAFGWAVQAEDSFARRMEQLNPHAEVLNLGVPGYAIENIAAHMERTIPRFRPDRVVYLVHPNDFDPPLQFLSDALVHSELARRAAYTWHSRVLSARYDGLRRKTDLRDKPLDPKRVDAFITGLRRIVDLCREHDTQCLLVFGESSDRFVLERGDEIADYFLSGPGEALDLPRAVYALPTRDGHLGPQAHDRLAHFLVREMQLDGHVANAR